MISPMLAGAGLPADSKEALQAVCCLVSVEIIDQILLQAQKSDKRKRRLRMRLVVMLVIAMSLFSDEDISGCLAQLVDSWKTKLGKAGPEVQPLSGSICKARKRLGAAPMRLLFQRLAKPMATPQLPGAFLFGKRTMGIDGSTMKLPDTPDNLAHFKRASGGRGQAAYPSLRFLALVETGTHIVCDVVMGSLKHGETTMMRNLLKGSSSIQPGMLLMWDSGINGFDLLELILAKGADFVCRIKSSVPVHYDSELQDGSWMAHFDPPKRHRKRHPERPSIRVRVIEYEVTNPKGKTERVRIMTSLLDEKLAGASELAASYHERWEVEGVFDEIKTHELGAMTRRTLRSRLAELVEQEFYGILLAHFCVRAMMCKTAEKQQLDPDRLSFTGTLRVIRRQIPKARASCSNDPELEAQRIMCQISRLRLPQRRMRSNPRVVKIKMSCYKKKRPEAIAVTPLLQAVSIQIVCRRC